MVFIVEQDITGTNFRTWLCDDSGGNPWELSRGVRDSIGDGQVGDIACCSTSDGDVETALHDVLRHAL
jgi:hypothetical protein